MVPNEHRPVLIYCRRMGKLADFQKEIFEKRWLKAIID